MFKKMPYYENHIYWKCTTYTAQLSYKTALTLSLFMIPKALILVKSGCSRKG